MRAALFFAALCFLAQNLVAQPISKHPENPHYFVYKGKPTLIVSSGEHYGAVLNLNFDYARYLDALQKDGMNYTRIFTGSYVEKPGDFGIRRNTLAPDSGAFIAPWARSNQPGFRLGGNKFDLNRWDPAYFKRLKDFVHEASQRDIIVEVTLFSALYENGFPNSPMHWENNVNGMRRIPRDSVYSVTNSQLINYQENLVRKIVRELNAFNNVIFEVINEPWASPGVVAGPLVPDRPGWEKDWQNRIDLAPRFLLNWQSHIASIIRNEEAQLQKRHLIAQNFANYRYPLFEVDKNIDILNFHYAWPEAARLNYGWDRVVGFDESGFAGSQDATYRRQAWRFLLSGGGLFNNLDYSFVVRHEDGTFTNEAPGGGSPALRAQLRKLRAFMESLPFLRMAPDYNTVRLAPNTFTCALSQPGQVYAIFVEGQLRGDLVLQLPAGRYSVEWIVPETTEVLRTDQVQVRTDTLPLTPPKYRDEVALRIRRNERR